MILLLLLSLDHCHECEAGHSTIPTQALHDDLTVQPDYAHYLGRVYCPSLLLCSHAHGVPRIKPFIQLPVTCSARHIYENCAHHTCLTLYHSVVCITSLMLYHFFAANFFACCMTSARQFTQGILPSWQSIQLACVQRSHSAIIVTDNSLYCV